MIQAFYSAEIRYWEDREHCISIVDGVADLPDLSSWVAAIDGLKKHLGDKMTAEGVRVESVVITAFNALPEISRLRPIS